MIFVIILISFIFLFFLKFHFFQNDNLILKSATHWNNTFIPFFAICSALMGILHLIDFVDLLKVSNNFPSRIIHNLPLVLSDKKSFIPFYLNNKTIFYHFLSSLVLIIYSIVGILLVKKNGLYDKGIYIYSNKYDWHNIRDFNWVNPNNINEKFYYLNFICYDEESIIMKIPCKDKQQWDTILRRKF